jgi:hypothetical protein
MQAATGRNQSSHSVLASQMGRHRTHEDLQEFSRQHSDSGQFPFDCYHTDNVMTFLKKSIKSYKTGKEFKLAARTSVKKIPASHVTRNSRQFLLQAAAQLIDLIDSSPNGLHIYRIFKRTVTAAAGSQFTTSLIEQRDIPQRSHKAAADTSYVASTDGRLLCTA